MVAKEVVQPDGFAVGEKTDAASGFDETTVMFEPDNEEDADELAAGGRRPARRARGAADDRRGPRRADGAPLALVVGRDDADFGS